MDLLRVISLMKSFIIKLETNKKKSYSNDTSVFKCCCCTNTNTNRHIHKEKYADN